MRRLLALLLLAGFAPHASGAAAEPATSQTLVYERDVAPILRAYCAGCHNDQTLEGKLSVETLAQLRKGGEDHGDPIRPGKPDESFLIRSVEGLERPKMPPKDEPQPTPADRATLRRWVEAGAPGPAKDESILRSLVTPKLAAAANARPVAALDFSPDGSKVARGRAGSVDVEALTAQGGKAWNAELPGKANAVHFSRDSRHLAVATGIVGLRGVARVYDAADGALRQEFSQHSDVLYDAEFSPDGRLLATAGYDRVIRIWRVADGALERSIDVHKGAIFDLAWHPSGKVLASASADETVKLWRVSDGVRLDTLNQPQGELNCVLFSADGEALLAAGADRRIHLWQFVSLDAPALNPPLQSRFAHEAGIHALALSADGRHLLSSANDRTLKLWSLPDLKLIRALPPAPDVASAIAAPPGSDRFVLAFMDGSRDEIRIPTNAPESGTVSAAAGAVARSEPLTGPLQSKAESEPNDALETANALPLPVTVSGASGTEGDVDLYRIRARAGQSLWMEVNAARSGSKLDSRLEVLHPDGTPVEQVVLQATRDSWFTFRGKDSDTSDDFRLHNWAEMELDEFVYANGEVVRLWLYPRGPDSGFKVYPGEGKRQTYYGTTPLVHALGAPCYVVTPLPPGSEPVPNGLPVFRLPYANDDDPTRLAGNDSVLTFTPPRDGEYLVRVSDVRKFGGAEKFSYTLTLRSPKPDFAVTFSGGSPKVSPGSGREIAFKAERREGFEGPIRVDIEGLPPGFTSTSPVIIEAGQMSAIGVVYAAADATSPDDALDRAVKVRASASIDGSEVVHEVGTLGDLQVGPAPKLTVEILPSSDRSVVKESPGQPLEFSIRPGQTITARVRAKRRDFDGRIELGNEDSGRNLPHGLYVDNIGLNGLLIVEGQTEREFFLTASRIARPGLRLFHLRARGDDGQASAPAFIRVLPPASLTQAR